MTWTPVTAGYYETDHWHRKRNEALQFYNYTCQACGARNCPLDVHHAPAAYAQLWREDVRNLKPLCRGRCHKKGRYSEWEIQRDRQSMIWLLIIEWLTLLPLRIVAWLIGRACRCIARKVKPRAVPGIACVTQQRSPVRSTS